MKEVGAAEVALNSRLEGSLRLLHFGAINELNK